MAKPKSEAVSLREDFNLHVALLVRRDGVSKAQAVVTAYGQGRQGLDRLLGQGQLFDPETGEVK